MTVVMQFWPLIVGTYWTKKPTKKIQLNSFFNLFLNWIKSILSENFADGEN